MYNRIFSVQFSSPQKLTVDFSKFSLLLLTPKFSVSETNSWSVQQQRDLLLHTPWMWVQGEFVRIYACA